MIFDLSNLWNKQSSLHLDLSHLWNKQNSLRFRLRFDIVAITSIGNIHAKYMMASFASRVWWDEESWSPKLIPYIPPPPPPHKTGEIRSMNPPPKKIQAEAEQACQEMIKEMGRSLYQIQLIHGECYMKTFVHCNCKNPLCVIFDLSNLWNKRSSLRLDLSNLWNKQNSLCFNLSKV